MSPLNVISRRAQSLVPVNSEFSGTKVEVYRH